MTIAVVWVRVPLVALNRITMTKETLTKANALDEHIRDLQRLIDDFTKGAELRVEGAGYGYPISSKTIQKDVCEAIVFGLKIKVNGLKEEFKAL